MCLVTLSWQPASPHPRTPHHAPPHHLLIVIAANRDARRRTPAHRPQSESRSITDQELKYFRLQLSSTPGPVGSAHDLDDDTRQNAALVEQTSKACGMLKQQADTLQDANGNFRVA